MLSEKANLNHAHSEYILATDLSEAIQTKTLEAESITSTKRMNVFDLIVSNYFEVGGVAATIYVKAPKVEAANELIVGDINVGSEITALKNAIGSTARDFNIEKTLLQLQKENKDLNLKLTKLENKLLGYQSRL